MGTAWAGGVGGHKEGTGGGATPGDGWVQGCSLAP